MAVVELRWKSPYRKLVRFFERSRDRWKAKYLELRKEFKLMGNQVRAVEKSRQRWKQVAKQAQRQVCQLQQDLEQHKKSVAA
jgi:hypothetical protein